MDAQLYNDAYAKYTPEWFESISNVKNYIYQNNRTLIEFVDNYLSQFLAGKKSKILDLGCGFGGLSLHLANLGHFVTGLDISDLAITGAKDLKVKLFNGDSKALKFKTLDVTGGNDLKEKYDIIIDSHLLHCITDKNDRLEYFKFVRRHMNDDSIWLLETMAFQKNLKLPIGYYFDEDYILYKGIKGVDTPIRKILPSFDLEEEIKNAQFSINYLYFHAELNFQVFDDKDYPYQFLPQTIRLAAKKN